MQRLLNKDNVLLLIVLSVSTLTRCVHDLKLINLKMLFLIFELSLLCVSFQLLNKEIN